MKTHDDDDDFAQFDGMIGKSVNFTLAGLRFKGIVRQVQCNYDTSRGNCLDLQLNLSLARERPPKDLIAGQDKWGQYKCDTVFIELGAHRIEGPKEQPKLIQRKSCSPALIAMNHDDIVDAEVIE